MQRIITLLISLHKVLMRACLFVFFVLFCFWLKTENKRNEPCFALLHLSFLVDVAFR